MKIVTRGRGLILFAGIAAVSVTIIIAAFRSDISSEELPELDVARDGVPVLAYHYFRDGDELERVFRSIGTVLLNLPLISPKDEWTVSAGTFERHLRYLEGKGYRAVTMHELLKYMKGEIGLKGKCVVLTFDDGDESVYRYAFPLLKKYRMKGTLFLITSRAGRTWNELNVSSWEDLDEMQQSGSMDIESHTHDLHYKTKIGNDPRPVFDIAGEEVGAEAVERILGDLRRSRSDISSNLDRDTAFLAWPFGFGSVLSDSLAGVAGFEGTFTLRAGTNFKGGSLYGINRYTITARTSLRTFRRIVSGSYVIASD